MNKDLYQLYYNAKEEGWTMSPISHPIRIPNGYQCVLESCTVIEAKFYHCMFNALKDEHPTFEFALKIKHLSTAMLTELTKSFIKLEHA